MNNQDDRIELANWCWLHGPIFGTDEPVIGLAVRVRSCADDRSQRRFCYWSALLPSPWRYLSSIEPMLARDEWRIGAEIDLQPLIGSRRVVDAVREAYKVTGAMIDALPAALQAGEQHPDASFAALCPLLDDCTSSPQALLFRVCDHALSLFALAQVGDDRYQCVAQHLMPKKQAASATHRQTLSLRLCGSLGVYFESETLRPARCALQNIDFVYARQQIVPDTAILVLPLDSEKVDAFCDSFEQFWCRDGDETAMRLSIAPSDWFALLVSPMFAHAASHQTELDALCTILLWLVGDPEGWNEVLHSANASIDLASVSSTRDEVARVHKKRLQRFKNVMLAASRRRNAASAAASEGQQEDVTNTTLPPETTSSGCVLQ